MTPLALRVDVNPALFAWARERSGINEEDLARLFPKLVAWEAGTLAPTLKQLEHFARRTHTPVGFLLLPEAPREEVPIPDYRTRGNRGVSRPSADLLDTIFQCQQRQEWYRGFAESEGDEPVAFVGSMSASTPVVEAAATMRETLAFEVDERGSTWGDALRALIDHAEDAGVLVMVNGVVGSNTHRPLDPDEFGGFALVDPFAPVVFVNGADTKAAQIFTLAHELAHVWLGDTALTDTTVTSNPDVAAERWCNQVSGEFLVPASTIAAEFHGDQPLTEELDRLARRFKVSTLVVLRRARDTGHIDWDAYPTIYEQELARIRDFLAGRGTNRRGNFFNTQPLRVSRRFARALITSTLEGETLRRDALEMLAFKKLSTFDELASRLGVG